MGAPSGFGVTLNNHGNRDYSSYNFDSAGLADQAWNANDTSYQFTFDTTSWPTGSYAVTVFTKDSNGRTAVSAPITLTIPAPIVIQTTYKVSMGMTLVVATFSEISNISEGQLTLLTSNDGESEWNSVGLLGKVEKDFSIISKLGAGTWFRVSLSGAREYLDSLSKPVQVEFPVSVKCSLQTKALTGSKISGSCIFSSEISSLPITLQSNSGFNWATIATGVVSSVNIPISVTAKKAGSIKFRLLSPGIAGKYTPFVSNIISISVKNKK